MFMLVTSQPLVVVAKLSLHKTPQITSTSLLLKRKIFLKILLLFVNLRS
jgi:hypothetical protein